MNYKTHQELKKAIEKFVHEYEDHPLMADTAAKLKVALYDLDAMLMSPGQKVVASYVKPTGQESIDDSPKHQ